MKNNKTLSEFYRYRKRWMIFNTIFILFLIAATILINLYVIRRSRANVSRSDTTRINECPSAMSIIRYQNNILVRPLLLTDVEVESPELKGLKGRLTSTILQHEQNRNVTSVSLYLRKAKDGKWIAINGNQGYYPGSLMKIPIMIYYLKKEQDHPGILNSEMLYTKFKVPVPTQSYVGDSILEGHRYKVAELLRYMIVESDNHATMLLSSHIDADEFNKLFTDLNLPPDRSNDFNYAITAQDFSRFLRVLFNGTYLNQNLSEVALELLSYSKFSEGIAKELPPDVPVPRKFGEEKREGETNFSESAIIYKKNDPYLLTIMTTGNNIKDQVALISELSKVVYDGMND